MHASRPTHQDAPVFCALRPKVPCDVERGASTQYSLDSRNRRTALHVFRCGYWSVQELMRQDFENFNLSCEAGLKLEIGSSFVALSAVALCSHALTSLGLFPILVFMRRQSEVGDV